MTDSAISRSAGDASRRTVMGGMVGLGVGVPLLAACGSDGEGSGSGEEPGGESPSTGTVGTTSEVPVGGGTLFAADKVVVSQPEEGTFRAFSAVCTHRGCVVAEVVGTEISCDCHGSVFSTEDGSVVTGPATKPLPELKVTLEGEDIVVS